MDHGVGSKSVLLRHTFFNRRKALKAETFFLTLFSNGDWMILLFRMRVPKKFWFFFRLLFWLREAILIFQIEIFFRRWFCIGRLFFIWLLRWFSFRNFFVFLINYWILIYLLIIIFTKCFSERLWILCFFWLLFKCDSMKFSL